MSLNCLDKTKWCTEDFDNQFNVNGPGVCGMCTQVRVQKARVEAEKRDQETMAKLRQRKLRRF